MRLSKLLEILEVNTPQLNLIIKGGQTSNVRIEKADSLFLAIEALSTIPSLHTMANTLLGSIPRPDKNNTVQLNQNRFVEINTNVKNFQLQADQLIQILKSVVVYEDENLFYFKVPQELGLESLAEVIKKIDQAFMQILNTLKADTRIGFKGFDTGSSWLVLHIIGGMHSVRIVLKIIDAVMNLAAKSLELKKARLEVESLKMDNDHKEQLYKIHKAQIMAIERAFAEVLVDEQRKDRESFQELPKEPEEKNAEDLSRVVHSLDVLKGIVEDGGSVELPLVTAKKYSALSAQIEISSHQLEQPKTVLLKEGAEEDL